MSIQPNEVAAGAREEVRSALGLDENPFDCVSITVASPAPAPAAATTLSIEPRAGGGVVLRLLGVPGRSYTIQVSTDLATWDELATVAADAQGLYTVEDPEPPAPARFYRAVYNR